MGAIRQELTDARDALAAVFRNPGLRRINLALAGSATGDWAYVVASSVYIFTQDGAVAVGLVSVVRFALMALLSPFTSSLADRFDRRRVMLGADLNRAALILAATVIIATDGPAVVVYALVIGNSLGGTPFRSAQAALLPHLAEDPSELTAANAAANTINSMANFVGPAIAGVMLASTAIEVVFAFQAATFVWSAWMVWRIDTRTVTTTPTDHGASPPADDSSDHTVEPAAEVSNRVMAGFAYIARDRDLLVMVLLYAAQTVVAGAVLVMTVTLALDELELGEGGLGLLNTASGLAGLFGGVLALTLARRGRLASDFGLGVMLWALPLVVIGLFPTLPVALAGMAVIGAASSVVDINAETILMRLVPDAVMGRVFGAVETALIVGMAAGSLAMPLLIEGLSFRTALLIIGGVVTALTLLGFPALDRIDRISLVPDGVDVLRSVDMFAALERSTLETLARSSRVGTFSAGTTVFTEGDRGDGVYVIEAGTVATTIRGQHVRDLGRGDVFGEIALLRDVPRTATITATEDLVVRIGDREPFLDAVSGHGTAADRAEELVAARLRVV